MNCWALSFGLVCQSQGNLNWVASRQHELTHPVWNGREAELVPLCNAAESDSANLDHLAELLVQSGFDPQEALMLLVPEAYRNHPDLMKQYPEVRLMSASDAGCSARHHCLPYCCQRQLCKSL